MGVLVISEVEQATIRAALERAAKHPIPLDVIKASAAPDKVHVKLEDRKAKALKRPQSENVLLPIGYRAAISFEQQPMGLCKHLSISVGRPGYLPSPEAVKAIAREFGMIWPNVGVHLWIEEFEPGHDAINLLAP